MFLPYPRVKVNIVGSLRDRKVACSASDRQGSNFESCVWRTVSSHRPQEVLLARFSLYVHKGGLKSDSFHFIALFCIIAIEKHIARILHFQKRLFDKVHKKVCSWDKANRHLPYHLTRSPIKQPLWRRAAYCIPHGPPPPPLPPHT